MPQLQIDLVVDDKGSRQIADFESQVDRSMAGAGASALDLGENLELAGAGLQSLLGTVAAVSTAIGALVITSANQAREMDNLSRLAKMNVQDFTAYGFAVQKVGLDAEKLGDISKDVQDKLGDFIATGGGEFKDFFENVAPKVGLTAAELQKLSGPDVLVAVKKAMDDANVSASEQVFYLEAIANDASRLLPLLADNGAALKKNAERAREFGLALSDINHQRLLDAKNAADDVTGAFTGLKNNVAAEFAPAFTAVMEQATHLLVGARDEAISFSSSLGKVFQSVAGWEALGSGRLSFLEFATMNAEDLAIWLEKDRQGLHDVQLEIDKLVEERNNIKVDLYNKDASELERAQINNRIAALKAEQEELRRTAAAKAELDRALSTSSPHAKLSSTAGIHALTGSAGAGHQSLVSKQADEYVDTWALAYNDRSEIQSRMLGVLAEREEAAVKDNEKLSKKALEEKKRIARENDKLIADSLAAVRSDTFVDSWALMYSDRHEVQSRYLDLMVKEEDTAFADMENAVSGWANGFGRSLSDAMWEADASFAGIAESFGRMLTEMAMQQLVVQPMLEGLFGSKSAGTQGLLSGAGDWLANIFSFHEGGMGVAEASFRREVPMVAFADAPRFHNGRVPWLAPGEIPAIIKDDEGVFTPQQMAAIGKGLAGNDGGAAVFNLTIVNNGDNQASVSRTQNDSGGMDIEVIIDKAVAKNINRHGSSTNKAMRTATGASTPLLRR